MVALIWMLVLAFSAEGAPVARDTPGVTQDSLRFLVLADWGGSDYAPYSTSVQRAVAKQMGVTAEKEHANFVLTLGDNIYMTGVRQRFGDRFDPRFQTTFEHVYSQDSLQIPWYLIAGNHDYYGNVRAQIEYSGVSDRWNFPDFYYKITKTLPGGKIMDIIMLDTIILCGNIYDTPHGHRVTGVPEKTHRAEMEWLWIEHSLKESTADYLLVAGHYPVYAVGSNGPTYCLCERLEPLLHKYHVTAYLSGHDHNLQHIKMERDNGHMDYFIIGSGSYADRARFNFDSVPRDAQKFFFPKWENVGGFALFDVSDSRMKMSFIDSRGKVQYEYNMQPRKLN